MSRFYKIGELTELLGITPRTVRYYDQMGLLPHMKRSSGKIRLFDDNDVETIKTIRRLQKEDRLSLDEIREHLFGSSYKGGIDIVIVTDDWAHISKGEFSIVDVLDMDSEKNGNPAVSKASLQDCYEGWIKRGTSQIFSIHTDSQFSATYANAVQAAKKFSDVVTVVDTQILGSTVGLFVRMIVDSIQQQRLHQEIAKFIDNNVRGLSQITAAQSIGHVTKSLKKSGSAKSLSDTLSQELSEWVPIFKQNSDHEKAVEILDICAPKDSLAVSALIDAFEMERDLRGGYMNQMAITHYKQPELADALLKELKSKHLQIPVHIVESKAVLADIFGKDFISLAIV